MTPLDTTLPDVSVIVSWPQAVVAVVLVLAVLVWPGVQTVLSNRRIEKTLTTNNGGSTVLDKLDQLQVTVDHIDKRVKRLETETPARRLFGR